MVKDKAFWFASADDIDEIARSISFLHLHATIRLT